MSSMSLMAFLSCYWTLLIERNAWARPKPKQKEGADRGREGPSEGQKHRHSFLRGLNSELHWGKHWWPLCIRCCGRWLTTAGMQWGDWLFPLVGSLPAPHSQLQHSAVVRKSGLRQTGWKQQPCSGKPDEDHLHFLWLLTLEQTQSSQNNSVSFCLSSQTTWKYAHIRWRPKPKDKKLFFSWTGNILMWENNVVSLHRGQSFLIKQYHVYAKD